MVVFTCNNCGDSVKKPKVKKHVTIECKKKYAPISLCCVDCLKDFTADTFAEHTKCVTELERYSAKGFVSKPSSNKGERKQNSWVEVIKTVMNLSTLSRQQRELVQTISNFDNIPRKKAKFQNFVRSSVRHIKVYPDIIDSVFNLLEEHYKATTINVPVTNSSEADIVDKPNADSRAVGEIVFSKTRSKSDAEEKQMTADVNSLVNDWDSMKPENDDLKPKKKKRKKGDVMNDDGVTELSNEAVYDPDGKVIKDEENCIEAKKHKKCKKKTVIENEADTPTESEANLEAPEGSNDGFEVVEKRKKHKKTVEGNNIAENENPSMDNAHLPTNTKTDDVCENNTVVHSFDDDVDYFKGVSRKKRKKLKLPVSECTETFATEIDDISDGNTKKKGKKIHTTLQNSINENSKKNESTMKDEYNTEECLENVAKIEKKEEFDVTYEKVKKKTKRKLSSNDADHISGSKKIKHSNKVDENGDNFGTNNNDFNSYNKFMWEDVIKSLLNASCNNELSLKKMTKKIVKEYQNSFSDNKSYDEVAKILNKKLRKLPFVTVSKEKVVLCT